MVISITFLPRNAPHFHPNLPPPTTYLSFFVDNSVGPVGATLCAWVCGTHWLRTPCLSYRIIGEALVVSSSL